MEKKATNNTITTTTTSTATATTKPSGSLCEKLFNAINTNNTFRPLRLLTNRQQEPAAPQSGAQCNNLSAPTATTGGAKQQQEKPKVAFTPSSVAKNDVKTGTDKKDAPHVGKKDPKGTTATAHNPVLVPVPVPAPPKGAVVPHPAPPAGAGVASTDTTNTKPNKSLNEKIDEYINRTKVKLRSHSTLGRTSTTK